VLAPHLFHCAEARAWVGEDDTLWAWFSPAQALLVGTVQERPAAGQTSHPVVYCPQLAATMHQWLMAQFTGLRQDGMQREER